MLGLIALVTVLGLAGLAWWVRDMATPSLAGTAEPVAGQSPFTVRRLPRNPIITHEMDPRLAADAQADGYANVNGPSLIRVPDWVENPLGRYYLYFAHHKGTYIRLAYADAVAGPWTIHSPGALDLRDSHFLQEPPALEGVRRSLLDLWRTTTLTEFLALLQVGRAALQAERNRRAQGVPASEGAYTHIASPDAIVDHDRREIRLYYHGLERHQLQMSRVAVSTDGLHFRAMPDLISAPYLRVFRHHGTHYGLAMPGLLYRSRDGLSGFHVRRKPLFDPSIRHAALWIVGHELRVFYTRVGDAPERILCSTIDIASADWRRWTPTPPSEVLRPELHWEGADLPVQPSVRGEGPLPVRELRDPAIFEEDGRVLLLYSAAGEQAIGIAELVPGTAGG